MATPPPADPDTVAIDRSGSITGTPDSVVVGGALYDYGNFSGKITAFNSGGTSSDLVALPNPDSSNPQAFTVDPQGRLVFIAYNTTATSS